MNHTGVTLALDATHAYVLGDSIWRVPLTGGAVETLASACTTPDCYPTPPPSTKPPLLLDDTSLYFKAKDGSLRKMPKAGGASSAVTSSAFTPGSIDATDVYGWYASGTANIVAKVPKDGGALSTLHTLPDSSVARIGGVGANADGVTWLEVAGLNYPGVPEHKVFVMPLAGGAATLLASGNTWATTWGDLGVQGNRAFWWVATGGINGSLQLWEVPTAGGPAGQLGSASQLDLAVGPSFDGTTAYWAVTYTINPKKTEIFGATPGSPAVSVVSGNLGGNAIMAIAVDACSIYWLTDKAFVRRPK